MRNMQHTFYCKLGKNPVLEQDVVIRIALDADVDSYEKAILVRWLVLYASRNSFTNRITTHVIFVLRWLVYSSCVGLT
jgi:hypothetical protein